MLYIKPIIKLPLHPFINLWIDAEYRAVKTYYQLIQFTFYCLEKSEIESNTIRSDAYKRVGYTLYSIITGKSYETLINTEI